MPKFSVVVPIYKVEKYLPRCIDSLIGQTLKDIEIILVDDGSPDGSPAICDEYAAKDNRIKVIHKKNEGVSAARNDGLAQATGEWVICFDSDDWAETDACENIYKAGEESGADVVIADIFRVMGGQKTYSQLFEDEFEYTSREDIKNVAISVFYPRCSPLTHKGSTTGFGGPWNKAVRRSLIAEHGLQFNTDLMGVYDDRMFALNAYVRASKIKYIHKAVYNYVLVENSITRVYKPHIIELNEVIFRIFSDYANEHYQGDSDVNKAYNALVINRLCDAFIEYIFNSRNTSPWSEKKQLIGNLIGNEPYKTAVREASSCNLGRTHKYVAMVATLNSPAAIRALFMLRSVAKRVRGR